MFPYFFFDFYFFNLFLEHKADGCCNSQMDLLFPVYSTTELYQILLGKERVYALSANILVVEEKNELDLNG